MRDRYKQSTIIILFICTFTVVLKTTAMEYKTIESAPKYEISNNGIVRNKESKKIVSQRVGHKGYYRIGLYTDVKQMQFSVHRLVLQAWVGNPNNLPCCNHIDGDKLNNDISNLEWCTISENGLHAYATGLRDIHGEKHPSAKLTQQNVDTIREYLVTPFTNKQIAYMFGVSPQTISNIKNGWSWAN